MSVARLCRVGTPYNGVDLSELYYEQSADVMYLAHINYPPQKLIRHAHDSWEYVELVVGPSVSPPSSVTVTAFTPDTGTGYSPTGKSYTVTSVDENGQESENNLYDTGYNDLSLRGNSNQINWSAVTGAVSYNVYAQDNGSSTWGYIGYSLGTQFNDANGGIIPDYTNGPPSYANPFNGAGNYPSTVTLHEQRTIWARSLNHPNAFWTSRSGDYENFDVSRPLKASDAISAALSSGRVNAINQLVSTTSLVALTSDAIFSITGGGTDVPLSPTDIRPRRQIGRGSSRLKPLVVDNVIFYQTNVGCSVRGLNYSFESDGLVSNDVSIFSPHFFQGRRLTWWAYAQEPRSLVWVGLDNGDLLCFTWEQEQGVWGWTKCDIGGEAVSGCVISETGVNGHVEDRLYMVVKRRIGEVDKLYIERMAAVEWDDVADTCFLDCAVSYDFTTPTASLIGLDHLEGQTLSALVDGVVYEGLVVSGGAVTLPVDGTKVSIGLPYTALIETLPLSMQTQTGSPIAKPSSLAQAVIQVVDTRGIFAGVNESQQYEVKPREKNGAAPSLVTGNLTIDSAASTEDKARYVISMPYPLPATITAVLLEPVISG